jgi:hypothetical protein
MVANADGSAIRTLAARKISIEMDEGLRGEYRVVRWSPDGRRIVGIRTDSDSSGNNAALWEIDASSGAEKLTRGKQAK